jgi:hypothetical protein
VGGKFSVGEISAKHFSAGRRRQFEFLPQEIAIGQIRSPQLLELLEKMCGSAGVASAEFQPSNDHPLPCYIILDVCNVALGVGQAFLEQNPIQNSRHALLALL